MDEALRARVREMKEAIFDAIDAVSAADDADEHRQLEVSRRVDRLVVRWKELLASAGDDGAAVEAELGRRMMDLRRDAADLARRDSGSAVPRALDAGHVPFLERRAPPTSIVPGRAAPTRDTPRFRVGGDVDAWCGKCGRLTEHHIVAMVGTEPKQVICQVCNSKHNYRTEPARGRGGAVAQTPAAPTESTRRPLTAAEQESARRRAEKDALVRELTACESPRPFDPRERYKAGEIISHPEHGRGRIENVLRASMLVRFRDGLRPLDLA